jgi:SAM-dependent methyltransferase
VGEDLLWLHLQELPAFRALLRATEARFYADLPLVEPILDLGCGDGHFGAVALPCPPQVGLDPWAALLAEARRRGKYRLLVRADGGRTPFPDGAFATVISNSVLEHIPDVEPVLVEVARVLRPGGAFYFSVPGPNFLPFLSIGQALDRVGLRAVGGLYRSFFNRISRHYHCNEPEVWRRRLEKVGLRLVRWWPYFSQRALTALEWGHYLGLPSLVAKRLFGRWVLWPSRANLWLTERLLRPLYEEPLPRNGAYLFFVAERSGDDERET